MQVTFDPLSNTSDVTGRVPFIATNKTPCIPVSSFLRLGSLELVMVILTWYFNAHSVSFCVIGLEPNSTDIGATNEELVEDKIQNDE